MEIGQVVYSKNGRDKGLPFIVKSIEGEYVFLVDGDLRKLEKPKKKKMRHVQITNYVCHEIKSKLENNSYILDAEIRKALE